MKRTLSFLMLLCGVSLGWSCGEQGGTPSGDLGPGVRRDRGTDLRADGAADARARDLGRDAPVFDLQRADAPVPDLPGPDGPLPDLLRPDAPLPDLLRPDAPLPDLLQPDAPLPDLLRPDAGDPFELLRQQLINRRRRLIFNNDGDDVLLAKSPTPAGLLAVRTSGLELTHVDAVFYCTTRGTFSRHSHRSLVAEPYTNTAPPYQNNIVPALNALGTDPLQVMVDWAKQYGREIFWSQRMNDMHDAGNPALMSNWKKQHPAALVGSQSQKPAYCGWTQVDYGRQDVRDQSYKIIAEVCDNYAVDGVELDFFRHPCYLRAVANGAQATQAERDTITAFVKRVRAAAESAGRKRGRPILLAVRVPDSVPICRAMGLDLERWLSLGLVDLVTGSGYFRANPWSTLAALGKKHGVKVYAGLSDSRISGDTAPLSRRSQKSYLGRAHRAWQAGVDGIYLFNMFNPKMTMLKQLGEPTTLARLDKTYFATVRTRGARSYNSPDYWLAGGAQWLNMPLVSPLDPLALAPQQSQTVMLELGDDPAALAAAGNTLSARLYLAASGGAPVTPRLNGQALSATGPSGPFETYAVPPAALRPGQNSVALAAGTAAATGWHVQWNAAAGLPALPWTTSTERQGIAFAQLQGGALLVADRGTSAGDYFYVTYPWEAKAGQQAEVEAEVKVISGWNNIIVSDGTYTERVALYPDRVATHYTKITHPMTTTDAFHTYRVVIKGQDLQVHVDGTLRLNAKGAFTQPAAGRNNIAFGAGNSPSKGEALWKAIRLKTPGTAGALLHDLALTVTIQTP